MAANGFSVTISAVDNASKTLDRVNRAIAGMQAPAKRFGQAVSKFGELTGLTKIGRGFEGIVRTSLRAASSVARVAEPLAAITGATSIGGFVAITSKWAEFNTQLGFAAQRMGVLPEYLGRIRAQATLAGTSGDAAQSGFENLGQTLYDVSMGQAPQAAYIMSRLGISLTDTAGRARKASDVLPGLIAGLRSIKDPLAQARAATYFFGGATAEMLPVIRMTNRELEENRQRVLRYGGTTNRGVAAAYEFSQAQAAVGQAVVGLTDAIETELAPVISPLLLQLADWIAQGRTSAFVTHDLGQGVKDFGAWLKTIDFHKVLTDVDAFANKVVDVLRGLDQWRTTLDGIAGFFGFGGAPAPAQPSGSAVKAGAGADPPGAFDARGNIIPGPAAWGAIVPGPMENFLFGANPLAGGSPLRSLPSSEAAAAAHAMAVFQSLGWTREQAAGLAANIANESGFDPTKTGDSGLAYGAGQWHPDRQAQFRKWAGFDLRDPRATLDMQYAFKNYELTKGNERTAGDRLRLAHTAREAGVIDSLFDLRPGGGVGEAAARGQIADSFYQAGGADTQGQAGPSGKVSITITHDGIGKVTAKAKGNVAMPTIATVMSGAGPVVGALY